MSRLKHHYGSQVHIFNSPLLQTWLTELCLDQTRQPRLNQLVEYLYKHLLAQVLNQELPIQNRQLKTRMHDLHPNAVLNTQILNPQTRAITVNLARAGTYPSHLCYELLNDVLNPDLVRQDHIFAARVSNASHQVTGTSIGSHKIGGHQEQAFVFFPDPMGATGHTLSAAIDYYKNQIEGQAIKYLALHLIVTPEYLKHMTSQHSDVSIYALRVDRGLSSSDVLAQEPGLMWEQERGLNEKGYIVPGAGGLGELLNNSFV